MSEKTYTSNIPAITPVETLPKQFVLDRTDMSTTFSNSEYQACLDAITAGQVVAVNWIQGGVTRQLQLVSVSVTGILKFSYARGYDLATWTVAASSPHSITHESYDVIPRSCTKLYEISNGTPAGISAGDYYYDTRKITKIIRVLPDSSQEEIPLVEGCGSFDCYGIPFVYNGTSLAYDSKRSGLHYRTEKWFVNQSFETGATIGKYIKLYPQKDIGWNSVCIRCNIKDVFYFTYNTIQSSNTNKIVCFTDLDGKILNFDYDVWDIEPWTRNRLFGFTDGVKLMRITASANGYLILNVLPVNHFSETSLTSCGMASSNSEEIVDVTSSAVLDTRHYYAGDGTRYWAGGYDNVSFNLDRNTRYVLFRSRYRNGAVIATQWDSDNNFISSFNVNFSGTEDSFDVKVPVAKGASKIIFNIMHIDNDIYRIYECRLVNFVYRDDSQYPETINEVINTLNYKSVYDKGHSFGNVPLVSYNGYEGDKTFGDMNTTTYSDVIDAFDTLLETGYSSKESIGTASDGSTMYAYKFICKRPFDSDKIYKGAPTIVIMCAIHGIEKCSTYGMYYFLKDVLTNQSHEFLRYIKGCVNLYVIPVANPYGWNNNKRTNANSVDLNRNWDVPGWTAFNDPEYPDAWTGLAPFDQPETAAIRDFVQSLDCDVFIDYHTNGKANVATSKETNWLSMSPSPTYGDKYYLKFFDLTMIYCGLCSAILRNIFGDSLLGISGSATSCTVVSTERPIHDGCSNYWMVNNGIMSLTFEGFCGFVNGGVCTDDVKKGNTIIIGNYLKNLLSTLG